MGVDRVVRRVVLLTTASLVVVVAGTLVLLLVPSLRELVAGTTEAEKAYPVGTHIDIPDGYFRSTDLTLIIFARSTCAACQRAKPLLRALLERVLGFSGWSARFVSTGHLREDEERYRRDLHEDVPMDLIDPSELRLASVPTIVVVDREGRVVMSREGLVYSVELVQEVLAEIGLVQNSR